MARVRPTAHAVLSREQRNTIPSISVMPCLSHGNPDDATSSRRGED